MGAHKSIFVIAAAALGLLAIGCKTQTDTANSTGVATQPVLNKEPTTAKAERRDITGYRLLNGKLYVPPNSQAVVFAPSTAPVALIDVKVGDYVKRGQVIADLAVPGADTAYQQAKATYEAAKAAYESAIAQYEQPVRDLRRQLDQARSTERTLRQQTTPGGDASALQQAVAARQALEDQIKIAEAQSKTSVLPYKAQLDQARTALEAARAARKQAEVVAPISGHVLSIDVRSGEEVGPNKPVAHLADLAALEIKATVDPDDAPFVKKGTPVVILFEGFPDRKFEGRVTKVDTLPADADGRVRYESTIDFKNTDGLIKPGTPVHSVGVVAGQRKGVVAVPIDAVDKDSTGKPIVKVMENDNWKPVVVELGMSDGYFVEVKSGVKEGDSVQVVPGQGQWLVGTPLIRG
ncbi:MAG: hypothetical protein QOJ65_279 [Fimbriimonadaceae bacterium]|jgi:RND family efflux transporter MFP subunit|nr:hypothetical protein [Fimbriimonadaceae bacterium]